LPAHSPAGFFYSNWRLTDTLFIKYTIHMKHLHKILDTPALVAAMVVDLALVTICLVVAAPGTIEKIGMALLAVVVVLFSVRGWVIGNRIGKALWLCAAIGSFFLDLSFALVATDVQATATVDTELVRLTNDVQEADAALADLRQQYKAAGTRATMDQLQDQITVAESKADKYRSDRQKRLDRFESGGSKEITSAAISTAIYDALTSGKPGRISWLIVFALFFAVLQLTMITAATSSFQNRNDESLKKAGDDVINALSKVADFSSKVVQPPKRLTAPDDISRFVSITWTYLRNNRGNAAVTRDSFQKYTDKSPKKYPMEMWDKLMAQAVLIGLIKQGRIMEPNQSVAIKKLQEAME
jgi:multidrug efflux pump subunit AcrA (membrane-fusion protein)